MLRGILAVICGALAGGVFNLAIIMVSCAIYPPPEGADMADPETMKAYVASLPTTAFLIVLVAHAGGALVGGLVAGLIGRRRLVVGAIVGGLFLLGGIINVVSIPSPLWFVVLDLVSYVPCGILGAKLAQRRDSPTA